jgi:hypothetical protein
VAIPLFELVVFLWVPQDVRMERLRRRELARFGVRILPGGDMYEQSQAFLAWAASYDDGGLEPIPVGLRQSLGEPSYQPIGIAS